MAASVVSNHPVWDLYDEMRTARLNIKCIQWELLRFRRLQRIFDVAIAISSTSSIGGFWFMQNFVGGYIWKIVGALSVVFTALKPVLKLTEKVRRSQELLTSYKILDHDLHVIQIEVRHRQRYDVESHKELMKVLKRKAEIVKKSQDSPVSEKLQRAFEAQVRREMPTESFYIPE